MPLPSLALVLLAGLIHALWNIAVKKVGGDARFAFFTNVVALVVWAPLGLWLGVDVVPQWGPTEWLFVGLSGVLHVGYFVVLLRGYQKADLTVVYPVARGAGPLLSSLAALVVLGESMTLTGGLGLLGVLGGVFLIAGGPQVLRGRSGQEGARSLTAGVFWGGLTGCFIASYTVIDGYAVKVLALSPILIDYFGSLIRLPLLLPSVLWTPAASRRLWSVQWKAALLVAVASPISYALVLFAMRVAPLGRVAPAREVSMLFAALLGGRLLGESDRQVRLAGAGLIGVGVALLGW